MRRRRTLTPVTDLVDALITDHLNGKVERWRLYHNDPMYHAYLRMLQRVLIDVDCALLAIGRGKHYRREALNLLMQGPPDDDAAAERIREHAERVAELAKQPPGPWLVTPGAHDGTFRISPLDGA